jgi:hypothetical protein
MIALNTTQPVRFVPSWLRKAENPHTYLLRAGSIMEREMLEAELASDHRAAEVMPWDWDDAFHSGVAALLDADDAARLSGLYDAEQSTWHEQQQLIVAGKVEQAKALDLPEGDRQMLAEVRRILAEHWPQYRALVAQDARRRVAMPLLAFQQFCVGWKGLDAPFALGPDRRVAEASAIKVPVFELRSAGIEAYHMLYAAGAEKNSEAPSNSSDAPATSHAGAVSTEDGKSGGTSGSKTPA